MNLDARLWRGKDGREMDWGARGTGTGDWDGGGRDEIGNKNGEDRFGGLLSHFIFLTMRKHRKISIRRIRKCLQGLRGKIQHG